MPYTPAPSPMQISPRCIHAPSRAVSKTIRSPIVLSGASMYTLKDPNITAALPFWRLLCCSGACFPFWRPVGSCLLCSLRTECSPPGGDASTPRCLPWPTLGRKLSMDLHWVPEHLLFVLFSRGRVGKLRCCPFQRALVVILQMSRTVRFYSAKSLNRCHLHGPTGR